MRHLRYITLLLKIGEDVVLQIDLAQQFDLNDTHHEAASQFHTVGLILLLL